MQDTSLRAQLACTRTLACIAREQLALLQSQYEAAAIPLAAVVTQSRLVAQPNAAAPQLQPQRQWAQQQDQIAALLGGTPGGWTMPAADHQLPLNLPSRPVEQRSAIRVAEAQLHAASAQIGVVQAEAGCFADTAALFQALGGGRQNTADKAS